jgi:NADH:ubiquinone oxidoreductase subunit 6 (subunit J)
MKIYLYLGSISAVLSGWKVITSKNPILSVFWLVVTFAAAAFLLILLGVEFLPLLFIIVYVGAIAILFLFVVMLLNIKLVEITENATRYVPIGIITGLVFLYQIYFGLDSFRNQEINILSNSSTMDFIHITKQNNIQQIGELLYTDYWLYFIISSLILLVSMIGAIVLSLYHEESVKRQDLFAQIATEYSKTVRNVN